MWFAGKPYCVISTCLRVCVLGHFCVCLILFIVIPPQHTHTHNTHTHIPHTEEREPLTVLGTGSPLRQFIYSKVYIIYICTYVQSIMYSITLFGSLYNRPCMDGWGVNYCNCYNCVL